jgi:hypothetical protein
VHPLFFGSVVLDAFHAVLDCFMDCVLCLAYLFLDEILDFLVAAVDVLYCCIDRVGCPL